MATKQLDKFQKKKKKRKDVIKDIFSIKNLNNTKHSLLENLLLSIYLLKNQLIGKFVLKQLNTCVVLHKLSDTVDERFNANLLNRI